MLSKRVLNAALLMMLGVGFAVLGLARSAPVAGQDDADTEVKIEMALSAAPASVSADATIYDLRSERR